jgi:hypothetical protein
MSKQRGVRGGPAPLVKSGSARRGSSSTTASARRGNSTTAASSALSGAISRGAAGPSSRPDRQAQVPAGSTMLNNGEVALWYRSGVIVERLMTLRRIDQATPRAALPPAVGDV